MKSAKARAQASRSAPEAPDFAARVGAAGIEPAALVAALGALSYCQKASLLDLALQAQAPAAAQEEAER